MNVTANGKVIAFNPDDDALLNQVFARKGQSDWAKSLKRVARAQAIAWSRLKLDERHKILAEVDAEMERQTK